MSKLKVMCFGVSADGYGAGPDQSMENPLGVGGLSLHEWFFPTQVFKSMHGERSVGPLAGSTGIDNDFAARGIENLGAWILGRNMFSPARGPWQDHEWKGWWGENPPYHVPVFVLTHHARPSIEMKGGTVFHFVTDGIESALAQAKAQAKDKDIRVGGGVSTVRQYLKARLIDEMHIAVSPALLGSGESLFHDLNLPALGYVCSQFVPSEKAVHMVFTKA